MSYFLQTGDQPDSLGEESMGEAPSVEQPQAPQQPDNMMGLFKLLALAGVAYVIYKAFSSEELDEARLNRRARGVYGPHPEHCPCPSCAPSGVSDCTMCLAPCEAGYDVCERCNELEIERARRRRAGLQRSAPESPEAHRLPPGPYSRPRPGYVARRRSKRRWTTRSTRPGAEHGSVLRHRRRMERLRGESA